MENKGGRPPKYDDESVLSSIIEAYFQLCDKNKQLPSKAGLRYALDISRDTYNEYKKDRFPDTIKRAEDFMEQAWVNRLNSQSPTGAIFYLKNAFKDDYRDKHETDVTTNGKELSQPILVQFIDAEDNKDTN